MNRRGFFGVLAAACVAPTTVPALHQRPKLTIDRLGCAAREIVASGNRAFAFIGNAMYEITPNGEARRVG